MYIIAGGLGGGDVDRQTNGGNRDRGLGWWLLLAVHWFIIVNFLLQIGYGSSMVFFVVGPEQSGPLMGAANDIDFEMMTTRRLYASETWVAITGLSVYLAITELGPRLKRYRGF